MRSSDETACKGSRQVLVSVSHLLVGESRHDELLWIDACLRPTMLSATLGWLPEIDKGALRGGADGR